MDYIGLWWKTCFVLLCIFQTIFVISKQILRNFHLTMHEMNCILIHNSKYVKLNELHLLFVAIVESIRRLVQYCIKYFCEEFFVVLNEFLWISSSNEVKFQCRKNIVALLVFILKFQKIILCIEWTHTLNRIAKQLKKILRALNPQYVKSRANAHRCLLHVFLFLCIYSAYSLDSSENTPFA